jgi:hypothetical protein
MEQCSHIATSTICSYHLPYMTHKFEYRVSFSGSSPTPVPFRRRQVSRVKLYLTSPHISQLLRDWKPGIPGGSACLIRPDTFASRREFVACSPFHYLAVAYLIRLRRRDFNSY